MKTLKSYRQLNNLSEKALKNLQKEKIKKLLEYNISNIPFYKKLNFSLSNDPYNDIKKFPIINKKIFKENSESFKNPNFKKN